MAHNKNFQNDLASRIGKQPPPAKRTKEEGYGPDGTPLVSRRIFDKYDKAKDGFVNTQDFYNICYDCGYSLSDEELDVAMAQIDRDGNGKLSYKEFVNFWKNDDRFTYLLAKDPAQSEWLQQAIKYYRYFDEDRNGTLSRDEFKRVYNDLQRFGATPKTLDETIADLDDGQGGIGFNQFVEWQKKLQRAPQSNPQPVKVMPTSAPPPQSTPQQSNPTPDQTSSTVVPRSAEVTPTPTPEQSQTPTPAPEQSQTQTTTPTPSTSTPESASTPTPTPAQDQITSTVARSAEIPIPQPDPTTKVTLKSFHNKYLSTNAEGVVTHSSDSGTGESEQWLMEENKEYNKTAFKSIKYDRYLCCERDGKVVANRDHVGAWEHFDVEKAGEKIQLKAHTGKYVCAEPGGKIIGNREKAAGWEQFTVTKI